MSISDKIEEIKIKFADGLIQQDEILLHVEPLLMQVVREKKDETEVRKIVNDIERAIYTKVEPEKSAFILRLIDDGKLFADSREIKD